MLIYIVVQSITVKEARVNSRFRREYVVKNSFKNYSEIMNHFYRFTIISERPGTYREPLQPASKVPGGLVEADAETPQPEVALR
jgi:hypothetical protein